MCGCSFFSRSSMIDALAQTGELVELLGHRLVLDDVHEADRAFDVGDDRVRVRIPGEDHLILLHLVAVLRPCSIAPSGTCRRAPTAAFLSADAADDDLAFVRRDDPLPLAVRDVRPAGRRTRSMPATFDLARRLLGDTSRRATDVEGAQRELRARLADRLRGDDADRLAEVDHRHGGQVAAVAHPAEPALRLAGEHASGSSPSRCPSPRSRAPSPRRSAGRLRPAASAGPTRRARADPRRPRPRRCRRCARPAAR